MTPYYADATVTVYAGDCLDVLRELPDASVDAVVTDPPYGLEFMGKTWDAPWKDNGHWAEPHEAMPRTGEDRNGMFNTKGEARPRFAAGLPFQQWCQLWAAECLRVLKPGGHLLAFGGSRTYHRLTCAVEDSGFEIRDCITWHFGSGFPKSLNVTDALGRIVPPDARCACGPRSTRTAQDSQDGYPSSHGSDGEPPQSAGADGLAPAPSPADALGHIRGDLPADGLAVGPASSDPDAGTGHPSTEGSQAPSARRSTSDQPDASAQSGKRTSTSVAPVEELRRTAAHTQRTSGSAAGSASSSPLRNKHMACEVCGGFAIPQGLGTALKPATEFIVVARKPLVGTVAANVLAHGTGALNVDGCRIEHDEPEGRPSTGMHGRRAGIMGETIERHRETTAASTAGRWPANVVLDESQAAALDEMSGESVSRAASMRLPKAGTFAGYVEPGSTDVTTERGFDDLGGASRFFYTAKADAGERVRINGVSHPTVKPLALMRWLVRLVTPPLVTVCVSCDTMRYASTTPDGSTQALPAVRGNVPSEGQPPSSTLLLEGVRGPSDASDAPQPSVRGVRTGLHAGQGWSEDPAVLLETLRQPLDSAQPLNHQGLRDEREGLPSPLPPRPPDGDADGLRRGAPIGGSGDTRPDADLGRGGTSSERDQGRQPPRESASAGEGSSRPHPQAATEADQVPPLRREDRGLGSCATCGGALTKRPGIVLEPFAGSGSTVEACILEGFRCIAIEREADYLPLIVQRINRRRDPVAAVLSSGDDGGLFDLLDEETA